MQDIFSKSGDIKIAVIGGGTGSFTVLTGLKNYSRKIVALVNMADNGGSTGKLRDELGVLPPGDIRQCLVALARTPELRDLFNYRFDSGSLEGHAFGNLFLTALEKMTGDFGRAVELAGSVLNISGVVEPMTLTNVELVMKRRSGEIVRGEFEIGHSQFDSERPELYLEPNADLNPRAHEAIMQADIVVVAPGNLYGSLAPALVVPGVGEALAASSAMKVYVCNLVTKPGQTDGYAVADFADEVDRLAGAPFLDVVIYNQEQPSKELLERYAKEGELSVAINEERLQRARYDAMGARLLSGDIWQNPNSSDPIASVRTLIRHDPDAVAQAVLKAYTAFRRDKS
jgi:uncharacterized cofD-like protein